MITGKTKVIAHLGYPTEAFKAPMIYNPWFDAKGVDAVVVPLGVKPEDYAQVLRPLFKVTNLHGALVTMPHKVATTKLVDELTVTAKISGAANAILRRADGSLLGDMFDGAGFVRGVERKGRCHPRAPARSSSARAASASAIAASLASGGREARLFDASPSAAQALGRTAEDLLSRARNRAGLRQPRRLRHRRQRDAARHEAGRPAADRRRARSRRRRSSARS